MPLLLVLLLSSFISGCATTSADSFSEEVELKEVPTEVYTYGQVVSSEVKPAGKTIYIQNDTSDGFKSTVQKIKAVLLAKGFVVTNKRAEAYVYIYIVEYKLSARSVLGFKEEKDLSTLAVAPGSTGKTEVTDITTATRYTRTNNGLRVFNYKGPSRKIFEGLGIRIDSMSYGKRPVNIWRQSLWSEELGKILNSSELEELVINIADSKLLVPGTQEVNRKKQPGCIPRFGYDWDVRNSAKHIIKSVQKSSSAFQVGLRPGDEILAIDSYTAKEFDKDEISTPIYESLESVPFKIKRNGKILRLNIKPQILCD